MSQNQNLDNLVDISSLVNSDYKTLKKADLVKIVENLITAVTRQGFQIKDLKERDLEQKSEIKHLTSILKNAPVVPSSPGSSIVHINDDEVIALEQLQILKNKVKNRDMTLEEARIYDILVKNKRIAREGNKPKEEDIFGLKNADESRLLSLATKKPKE